MEEGFVHRSVVFGSVVEKLALNKYKVKGLFNPDFTYIPSRDQIRHNREKPPKNPATG
jgi:hypothetical protein